MFDIDYYMVQEHQKDIQREVAEYRLAASLRRRERELQLHDSDSNRITMAEAWHRLRLVFRVS